MDKQNRRFDGKVVIVTGAGRGLGEAYALLLAELGARVVVNDLADAQDGVGAAESVVAAIRDAGGQAVAAYSSVATPEGAGAVVATAMDTFGRIDAVVNNAGIVSSESWPELEQETVERHLSVHLFGSLNVTRAAWDQLVANRGSVVVTTSAAMLGNPSAPAYSIAKSATFGFMRYLAVEGSPVRVNAVMPAAETRMSKVANMPAPDIDRGSIRVGPSNVAPLIAYLAHEATDVSGEMFAVGRGFVKRVLLGITDGYEAEAMTVDDLGENFDAVMDAASVTPLLDFRSYREAMQPPN